MIAFFRRCSCPLISCFSSGIATKPNRANMIIPIGVAKLVGLIWVRFVGLICGANLMKMPMTIVITEMTPHVSIFFKPRSPCLSRRVRISQNTIPKIAGEMFGEISLERDCPSPIRYARSAE